MTASLIVAAAANEVIGRGGALPWHLPADLRRFRALTTGHVVVMGRLTHESIVDRLGHPLPGRTSIVVSRTMRGPGTELAGAGHPAGTGLAGAGRSEGTGLAGTGRPDGTGLAGSPHSAGDDRVLVVDSLESALAAAASIGAPAGRDEFFIIGGESVYRQALPSVDKIYLTRVHAEVSGDCRMPDDWLAGFELASREDGADPGSGTRYSFLGYRRIAS
ncbi:MAG TPA: dihydrofolate reductase [Streptosporangiaceae bacterium]